VLEHVAAPFGQIIHAELTKEYPEWQEVIAVYEVHAAAFLGQTEQAVPNKKNPDKHLEAAVELHSSTPGAHALQVVSK